MIVCEFLVQILRKNIDLNRKQNLLTVYEFILTLQIRGLLALSTFFYCCFNINLLITQLYLNVNSLKLKLKNG